LRGTAAYYSAALHAARISFRSAETKLDFAAVCAGVGATEADEWYTVDRGMSHTRGTHGTHAENAKYFPRCIEKALA